jgi:hypothetical protein
MIRSAIALAAIVLLSAETAAQAPEPQPPAPAGDAELAKKLANPVASLISVPLQLNYDCCVGPDDDGAFVLNIQPVIPFRAGENLDLIVRTILPLRYTEGSSSNDAEGFGFGDTTQSFFFAPPPKNGLTLAAGPVILWPTGTEGYGSGKWGAGITGLALKQQGPVTYGALANHIWSVAGSENRPDISNTFLQPFFNYTWPDTTGLIVNLESSYDWERDQWTIPLNTGVSHIYDFSGQKVSLGAQARVYLDRPEGGPDWGLRFVATFLFPK